MSRAKSDHAHLSRSVHVMYVLLASLARVRSYVRNCADLEEKMKYVQPSREIIGSHHTGIFCRDDARNWIKPMHW